MSEEKVESVLQMDEEGGNQGYKLGERIIIADSVVTGIQLNPSNKNSLYSGTLSGVFCEYDFDKERRNDPYPIQRNNVMNAQDKVFACSAFDLHNDMKAAGSIDGSIGMWKLNRSEAVKVWDDSHESKVSAVKFFTDQDIFSCSYDGYFKARNVEADKVVHTFASCACPLTCMAIESMDSVYLGSWDGQVKRLDLRMKQVVSVMKPQEYGSEAIRCFALGPSPAPPANAAKKKGAASSAEAFVLYVSYGLGQIKAWDMRYPQVMVESYLGHTDVVNCLLYDDNRLYSGSDDKTVRIFDCMTGRSLETLTGHTNGVTSIALQESYLLSSSYDKSVRQYDIRKINAGIESNGAILEAKKKVEYEKWLEEQNKGKKKGGKGKAKK